MRQYLRGTPEERFINKIDIQDLIGCWLWTGAKDRNGYGKFGITSKRIVEAHRFSYEIHRGQIPDDLVLDHLCRRPACVNPAHLQIVTRGENVLRGNGYSARNARKVFCNNGHLLSGENLYIKKSKSHPGRRCRRCVALYVERKKQKTQSREVSHREQP